MKPRAILLFLAVLPALAFAEPIKISRAEAYKLRVALEAIAPGLTPANTIVAADDLNALQSVADGVERASLKMQRENMTTVEGPDRAARLVKIVEDFDAKSDEVVEIDLSPIEISRDEIKEAKIAPKVLAPILRWLRPPKK